MGSHLRTGLVASLEPQGTWFRDVWRGHQLLHGQALSWSLFTICAQGHALGGSLASEVGLGFIRLINFISVTL